MGFCFTQRLKVLNPQPRLYQSERKIHAAKNSQKTNPLCDPHGLYALGYLFSYSPPPRSTPVANPLSNRSSSPTLGRRSGLGETGLRVKASFLSRAYQLSSALTLRCISTFVSP